TTPTRAQLAAAETYCADNVPFPGLPLKLTDTRGPFTFEVYSDDNSNDFCTTGPSFRNASGWRTSPPVTVPAGKLYLWAEHTRTDSGSAYGFVIARAGDDVSAATLTLDDGTRVTATVQNGWAVAWWPGSHQLTSAQLTTASGTETQMFPASPCGLHNCSGGPHGGAPGGGPGGGQHQLERLCRRRPRTVAAFFKPTDWNPPLWLETPPRVEAAFAGIEREKLTITEGPHKYRR